MTNKIILYNNYHNGDIFYSRMLTTLLTKEFEIEYHHNMCKNLFADSRNVSEVENSYNNQTQNLNNIYNTWIGYQNGKYLHPYKCSFKSYRHLYTFIYDSIYGKSKFDDYELLPTVNFQNLIKSEIILNEIKNIKKKFDKIILICNGNVLSGQSVNFNFDIFLKKLCNFFPKYAFLITNNSLIQESNLFQTHSITNESNDLLYLSLISTECDIIIGRASGPHCFTHIRENLLNKNKKFITFTLDRLEGVWFEGSESNQIWSNNFTIDNIYETIKSNI